MSRGGRKKRGERRRRGRKKEGKKGRRKGGERSYECQQVISAFIVRNITL